MTPFEEADSKYKLAKLKLRELEDGYNKEHRRLTIDIIKLKLERENVCNHVWIYDGHGHNSRYYVCNSCGAVKIE